MLAPAVPNAQGNWERLYAGSKATLAASLDRIQHAATAIISAILDDKPAVGVTAG